MDPVTLAALIGVGGKLIDAGVQLVKVWHERGSGGVALGTDGSRMDLRQDDRFGRPALMEPWDFGVSNPIPFDGVFVPADAWAHTCLGAEQPVLIVIEDHDDQSPLDTILAVLPLGSTFEGQLFPGTYSLGAFVFLNEDFTNWDNLDGGGLVEFSVAPGDQPFRLEIPIEATPEPSNASLIHVSSSLGPGQQEYYTVILEGNVTYHVYVNPINPGTDLDLYVYDENLNLIDLDNDPDNDALCTVAPRWTGPFKIVVLCHSGGGAYQLLVQVS